VLGAFCPSRFRDGNPKITPNEFLIYVDGLVPNTEGDTPDSGSKRLRVNTRRHRKAEGE
jgi:hypothetical protein